MHMTTGKKRLVLEEQIIEDPVSGLTLQFEVLPNGHGAVKVFGNIPFGNREFVFDAGGCEVGAGTAVSGPNKPTWVMPMDL